MVLKRRQYGYEPLTTGVNDQIALLSDREEFGCFGSDALVLALGELKILGIMKRFKAALR